MREPVTGRPDIPCAHGDGCHNDWPAIQMRLDLLGRLGAQPDGNGCWAEYAAALYFPAGGYRIDQRLRVPYLVNVRLFGDVAGAPVSFQGAQTGSFIQQSTPGEPILVFGDVTQTPPANFYGSGWAVENLGFTWTAQQEAPMGWTVADGSAACTTPGAVAILFTGPKVTDAQDMTTYYNGDHYLGRIVGCAFEKGWRGIAVDDRNRGGHPVAVWDTVIEKCRFSSFRGAAISYVNGPSGVIGMPNNSIVDSFVENYSRDNPEEHKNIDYQIRLSAQMMRMTNVGLEGSKFDILYADSSTLTIDNLHVENIHVEKLYGRLLYFGGGSYTIRGLDVDGVMVAWDPAVAPGTDPNQPRPPGVSTIISAGVETEVILSGVQIRPHPVDYINPGSGEPDPDGGGFIPLVGEAHLFQGGEQAGKRPSVFYLLDRPFMPIYASVDRASWLGPLAPPVSGQPPRRQYGLRPYKALSVYPAVFGATKMAPLVHVPETKVSATVAVQEIGAGSRVSVPVPAPGARPGDLVQVGLPATIPPGVMVTAVAATNQVVLWAYNATGALIGAGSHDVMLAVGGGPLAGGPQTLPPLPSPVLIDE